MPRPYRSVNDLLAQQADYGNLCRYIHCFSPSTTAANATSGYQTTRRYPQALNVPTMTSPVTGAFMTKFQSTGSAAAILRFCAIEFVLGTIDRTGGVETYTPGVSMPSRACGDQPAAQTATIMPMLYVTKAGSSITTPTLTITYTNQDGTNNRTATMTLPTNPSLNTAFCVAPHLQSGDTGIRSIQNMTLSGGTAITIRFAGLLVLNKTTTGATASWGSHGNLANPTALWRVESADVISFWSVGATSADYMDSALILAPETP